MSKQSAKSAATKHPPRPVEAARPRSAAQLKEPIFLSASIPDRPPYKQNSDPIAIREAVLALIAVAARERLIVFGGHPAISPLVEHAARSLHALDNIVIYQSERFRNVIPPEAKAFPNLKWTRAGRDRAESLEIMRREMIGSQPFCAAVFIGGMEGILDECRIFKQLHRRALILPIASTAGASQELFGAGEGPPDHGIRSQLLTDRKYRSLLRKILTPLT